MLVKSCFPLLLLISVVYGGYPGVVDDEIWHHVLKVLSKEHGGSKILLGHPEPAHLVDAYTKIEYHEPHYHHDYGHDQGHYGGGYHHHHHHHSHAHGYGHGHHHHHHTPVYKAPVLHSSYGPPYHHHHDPHHHSGHYKK